MPTPFFLCLVSEWVKKNNNSKKIKGQGERERERERESCERKREELGKSRETKTNEKMKGPSTNEGLALALPTSSHNSSESSQQQQPPRWDPKTNVKRLCYSRSTLSVDYPLIYLPKPRAKWELNSHNTMANILESPFFSQRPLYLHLVIFILFFY